MAPLFPAARAIRARYSIIMGFVSGDVGFVSVVDLSSGVVSDYRSNVPTLDFPAALRAGASEVSLDGIGLVHFSGADGDGVTERMRSSPVDRKSVV